MSETGPAAVAAVGDAPLGHPKVILVVDDDPEASRAIAEMIERLGHHAVLCGNASEAIERLQRGPFDLLLIDYRMPELTGLDLLFMLREKNCPIPVIMMSGYLATEERLLAEKSALVAVLQKPIEAASLGRAIDLGLHSSR
jgi:CheY-like chemotaxis protein